MKKIISLIIVLGIFTVCFIYNEDIVSFIIDKLTDIRKETTILQNNEYASNNNYNFVKLVDEFNPTNKEDIKNIYYTVINSGMTDFTFYCDSKYKDCIKDVDYISNNQNLLSNINNFVPVYNSFTHIETEFDSLGKITIHIYRAYNETEIAIIKNKIEEIKKEVITEDMTDENKIKVIHDYIINHTKYDIERSDNKVMKYKSNTAYGALIENYAICGGYADSMKLFLDDFNIPNYKISSENHIWNLVYINNNWYHLDLTWDDPVTTDGKDILEYDYFLITNEELKTMETDQHLFDATIYSEAI